MSMWTLARVVGACVLPIVLLEAGMQHFGEVGPLGPVTSTTLTESHGLRYPSRCLRTNFGRLEAAGDSSATLCTDAYGTIEPTSLGALARAAGASDEPYILACGGSTMEVAAVEPEDRWVAVLASRLSVPAVNAGASSKDLATCARTLDFLLRHAPRGRPPLILIASNVNTLGSFVAARSSPAWDGVSIPEQAYTPAPPHPGLRAWVPGLYHLAATLVANTGASADDGQYARELSQGCCHVPAAVNQDPARRFDWDDETNRQRYARFVAAMLGRIEAVLERHGVERNRVVFVEEPNSYGFADMPHLARDFRQRLRGLDGKPLDLATSATLTARYDKVYARVVGERFDMIRAGGFDLPSSAFYDAVHLTTTGSRLYGEHVARLLRRKLSGS